MTKKPTVPATQAHLAANLAGAAAAAKAEQTTGAAVALLRTIAPGLKLPGLTIPPPVPGALLLLAQVEALFAAASQPLGTHVQALCLGMPVEIYETTLNEGPGAWKVIARQAFSLLLTWSSEDVQRLRQWMDGEYDALGDPEPEAEPGKPQAVQEQTPQTA
jgi:hypothetical protein